MPWGLWLSACYVTPSLTWMGWSLVLRALDYIIQLQNKDFHVYFRENPLFISLYGSLVLLLRYFRVNEQNVVKTSRCDVLPLAESCSQKMPSGQMHLSSSAREKPWFSSLFFPSFLSLHARIQRHWGMLLSSRGVDEGWESANGTTDARSPRGTTKACFSPSLNAYTYTTTTRNPRSLRHRSQWLNGLKTHLAFGSSNKRGNLMELFHKSP